MAACGSQWADTEIKREETGGARCTTTPYNTEHTVVLLVEAASCLYTLVNTLHVHLYSILLSFHSFTSVHCVFLLGPSPPSPSPSTHLPSLPLFSFRAYDSTGESRIGQLRGQVDEVRATMVLNTHTHTCIMHGVSPPLLGAVCQEVCTFVPVLNTLCGSGTIVYIEGGMVFLEAKK